MRMLAIGLFASIGCLLAEGASTGVTFNKEVLRILQKQCQECHRPGEIAPMSFLSYQETRPWAKAIKEAVLTKKMPPWFAEGGHRALAHERALSKEDIDTLVAWSNNGAPEGDAKDKPAPVKFAEGWSIGTPDMVVEFPHEIAIPASGVLDQSNLLVKVNFPHDTWVKAAEVRPGNPKVVHHMKAWVRPPGSAWMKDAPEGEMYRPTRGQFAVVPETAGTATGDAPGGPRPVQDILAKYNPGVNAQEFTLGGAAKFIAAGSDIVFEIHYTTTGKPESGPVEGRDRVRARGAAAALYHYDWREQHPLRDSGTCGELRGQGGGDAAGGVSIGVGRNRTCIYAPKTTNCARSIRRANRSFC